ISNKWSSSSHLLRLSWQPINWRYYVSTKTACNSENTIDYCSSSKSHTSHHDLTSFLDYAARIQLDTKSTVYVGTHYEYTVQQAFERMGMSLKRVGGRDDYGTDIIGKWSVPSAPHPLKIFIQCKAHTGKVNPAHARELEGAITATPPTEGVSNILCLLVSPNSASKGVRETLGRSRWPMGFVLCTTEGKILQMIWNKSAAGGNLVGIKCGLRFTNSDIKQREVVLTWRGKALF
ncbi:hypothetical protein EPUL_004496, partial [Erysiphe pulchra]